MTRGKDLQRGMTLVEALIAVALLAALSSALAPALYGVMRATTVILNKDIERESLRSTEEVFEKIIGNAISLAAEPDALQFAGNQYEFSLVSLVGPRNIARRFRFNIQEGALKLSIAQIDATLERTHDVELLAKGAVSFSYYGVRQDGEAAGWASHWKDVRPPGLIRFIVISPSNEAQHILDYSPHSSGLIHCQFDQVSRRCRA